MSRWGKPIKNHKRRDPRYFLNEAEESPELKEGWQDNIDADKECAEKHKRNSPEYNKCLDEKGIAENQLKEQPYGAGPPGGGEKTPPREKERTAKQTAKSSEYQKDLTRVGSKKYARALTQRLQQIIAAMAKDPKAAGRAGSKPVLSKLGYFEDALLGGAAAGEHVSVAEHELHEVADPHDQAAGRGKPTTTELEKKKGK